MAYEILDDQGNVINRIVADPAFVEEHFPGQHRAITPPEPPPVIPDKVLRLQAKIALLNAGLLDKVETYVSDPKTDQVTKLAWAEAHEFTLASPVLLKIADAVGISPAKLQELFIAAGKVQV